MSLAGTPMLTRLADRPKGEDGAEDQASALSFPLLPVLLRRES